MNPSFILRPCLTASPADSCNGTLSRPPTQSRRARAGGILLCLIVLLGCSTTAAPANLVQQAYLKASNTDASDLFGWSVAISGDTIVVGVYGEASNATGVNGNQADNSLSFAGAAYLFARAAGNWGQQQYLKADLPGSADLFGNAVAISGDLVVVGACLEDGGEFDAGAAYTFGNAPPIPPPAIVSITYDPSQVVLECIGVPDASYTLPRSPDLATDWSDLGSETAQPDGTFFFVDYDPPPGRAFYRLMYLP